MRLDEATHVLYPHFSRTQIQSFIMQSKVLVNGAVETKAGTAVYKSDEIKLIAEIPPFVSRAGIKLSHALDTFDINIFGLTVLDAGISTGGFTDCLLQRGAKKVYGIDVGYGQTHHKIRNDPRVILYEKTNLRYLTKEMIGERVDCVTLDLSFISILKVIEAVKNVLKKEGILITLIKPQFEAEKHEVGAGGIIRDAPLRDAIVQKVIDGICAAGFVLKNQEESVLSGADGNRESIVYFINSNSI